MSLKPNKLHKTYQKDYKWFRMPDQKTFEGMLGYYQHTACYTHLLITQDNASVETKTKHEMNYALCY